MSHRRTRPVSLLVGLAHLTLTSMACIVLAGCASVAGGPYAKPVAEPVSAPDDPKANSREACQAQAKTPQEKAECSNKPAPK